MDTLLERRKFGEEEWELGLLGDLHVNDNHYQHRFEVLVRVEARHFEGENQQRHDGETQPAAQLKNIAVNEVSCRQKSKDLQKHHVR